MGWKKWISSLLGDQLTLDSLQQAIQKEKNTRFVRSAQLLEMNLEKALNAGEVLGPLRLVETTGREYVFRTTGYFSRFRKGDNIDLRVRTGQKTEVVVEDLTVKGIDYPSEGVIHVRTGAKQKNLPTLDQSYFMYPRHSSFFENKLINLLNEVDREDWKSKLGAIPSKVSLKGIEEWKKNLNSTQSDALKYLLERNLSGCIQGPPGSGKTHLLQAIVGIATQSGLSVGLTAYTHSAVDNALSRLTGFLSDYVRIGDANRVRADLYSAGALINHHCDSFSNFRGRSALVAATSHSWAMSKYAPKVDLLIIDEAAQMPSFIYPLIRRLAVRVILLGDHKQLAPVLQGNHKDIISDAFSLELQASGTPPMLNIQYRMNNEVQDWSSVRYYEGALKAHESNANRDVIRSHSEHFGLRSVQIDIHESRSQDHANTGEAERVASLVVDLFKKTNLGTQDIGIITPHRMQAGAVCQKLQSALGPVKSSEILVDTVERFQGQEKEVILLSFGAENDGDIYESKGGFLANPRRLNVAVTRAKSRFYCFAPRRLQKNASRNKAPSGRELIDFLAWCGKPDTKKAA